jgi:hypothetical protein
MPTPPSSPAAAPLLPAHAKQVSTSSDSVDDNFVWNFPIDVTFKCTACSQFFVFAGM